MLTSLALGFLVLVYVADLLALLYYGVHCYVMVRLYLQNRHKALTNPDTLNQLTRKMKKWPVVTVQLPMFNEFYVLERLIDATVTLDYPKDKLHIQVVDDSTDESRSLAEKKVREWRKKGYKIDYIHRTDRTGHKAGALRAAQESAKGEFIAIFDADFIPAPDFLRKTVPYFWESPDIGMVQTRWGHINADYSMLTKAQSIGIDGHFIIEQVARAGGDLWLNFNGTAGIWRKRCIYDAGNWESDTLTEDFDLSYRAELKGWKFRYISDVVNPAELPATVSAYKAQQFRWCKGSLQCAVKLMPRIWNSHESLKVRLEACTHLTNYSVHPLMVINILVTLPLLLLHDRYEVSAEALFALGTVFMTGTLGPMLMYMVSQRTLYPDSWKSKIKYLPVLTIIGTGLAINNTIAWLEALMGKQSQFVRTPKLRLTDKKDKVVVANKYNSFRIDRVALLEIAMGIYITITLFVAVDIGKYLVVPFLVLYALGFFYFGFSTISEKVSSMLAARAATSRRSV